MTWLCVWFLLLALSSAQTTEYRVGWQAPQGGPMVMQQYGQTFAAVSDQLDATFAIVPFSHDSDLQDAAKVPAHMIALLLCSSGT